MADCLACVAVVVGLDADPLFKLNEELKLMEVQWLPR